MELFHLLLHAGLSRRFPKIKAEAAEVGATIYFADEAGIRSDYHSHTTWAPVGVTPIVPTTGKRYSVNMLSAVSPTGAVHFLLHEGRADAGIFIDFASGSCTTTAESSFSSWTTTRYTEPLGPRSSWPTPRGA